MLDIGKLKDIPKKPGCYKYFDIYGNIIYIGKSKNLYNRVNSYFINSSSRNEKIQSLIVNIENMEYILTDSELDALILEYELIKKYRPIYNTAMKRDKKRPYLRISKDVYPALNACFDINDDSNYYSFFRDENHILETLELFSKIWKLPRCNRDNFIKSSSICIYYSMGECLGPCDRRIESEEYNIIVDNAISFLNRENRSIIEELNRKMEYHSQCFEFEKANDTKKIIGDMERLYCRASRIYNYPKDKNILVIIRAYNEDLISLFIVKNSIILKELRNIKDFDRNTIKNFLKIGDLDSIDSQDKIIGNGLLEITADKIFIEIEDDIEIHLNIIKNFIDNK